MCIAQLCGLMMINPHDQDLVVSKASETTDVSRLCASCTKWKPSAEFPRSRTDQFSYCRECRRAYDRRYYAERGKSARLARRRLAIDAARLWMVGLKSGIPCADCAQSFPTYVMHWDHLPGFEKVDDISSMVSSRTRLVVLEELKKCQLVCANCHVLRTIDVGRRRARSTRNPRA